MYLDGEEERMLRAIVQSAVAEAAAGRSFAGNFRHYRISASCLHVNQSGVAKVAVRVLDDVAAVDQFFRGFVLADGQVRT